MQIYRTEDIGRYFSSSWPSTDSSGSGLVGIFSRFYSMYFLFLHFERFRKSMLYVVRNVSALIT